ncbi:AAA family ATPase [Sphingobium yanoikuyae]
MLRLKSIEIRNFRAIEHAKVPLDRYLTVLVGENAAGKTAILDAIAAALSPAIDGGQPRLTKSVEPKDFRVTGLADPMGEVFREQYMSLNVETEDGGWQCEFLLDDNPRRRTVRIETRGMAGHSYREQLSEDDVIVPIIASYGADRATPPRRTAYSAAHARRLAGSLGRIGGYVGALESRAVYEEAVEWFEAIENLELRSNREATGRYRDRRLDAVRHAVSKLVPELGNLRMVGLPPRMMLDAKLPGRPPESLSVDQLSGGYRAMLALVIDLARRMADLNPDAAEPLSVPGVVLIDEIDLHLHPKWQQLVVNSLRQMFPEVQFILSTHSPQVLTTIEPHNILNLKWQNGHLIEEDIPSTSGAESGRLMSEVMGVEERPPAEVSKFVRLLEEYRSLVAKSQWDSEKAGALIEQLRTESPDDPVIGALELERRRLAAQKRRETGEA